MADSAEEEGGEGGGMLSFLVRPREGLEEFVSPRDECEPAPSADGVGDDGGSWLPAEEVDRPSSSRDDSSEPSPSATSIPTTFAAANVAVTPPAPVDRRSEEGIGGPATADESEWPPPRAPGPSLGNAHALLALARSHLLPAPGASPSARKVPTATAKASAAKKLRTALSIVEATRSIQRFPPQRKGAAAPSADASGRGNRGGGGGGGVVGEEEPRNEDDALPELTFDPLDVPAGASSPGDGGVLRGLEEELRELVETPRVEDEVETADLEGDKSFLPTLGEELYELFAGKPPYGGGGDDGGGEGGADDSREGGGSPREDDDGSDDGAVSSEQARRAKRGRLPGSGGGAEDGSSKTRYYVPLAALGVPPAICGLVTGLLDRTGDYGSMAEVEEDLRLLAADPRLLEEATGELRMGQNALYGREREVSSLLDAFDRATTTSADRGREVSSGGREMVLVSGYSGTGKSSLVAHVRDILAEKGAVVASGKFDAMRQLRPLSAIVTALGDYCNMLARDVRRIDQVREAVTAAIGEDGARVLANLVPHLHKIVRLGNSPCLPIVGKGAKQRLMLQFRMIFRATCSREHPAVLCLDDLQWADEMSLQLMQAVLTDPEIQGLLFVGSYRDNEVGPDHPLMAYLDVIRQSAGINVTATHIGNLNAKSLNALVSDSLRLAPGTTRSLAEAVMSKTDGNALFAVQFLASLRDEGLLHFSLSARRWEWDIKRIRNKDISDDVVELMVAKVLRLAPEVQEALKVASSFGAHCHETVFGILDRSPENVASSVAALDIAVAEGLLVKTESLSYRFSHDQIHSAAYLLIQESERPAFHLRVGRMLWKLSTAEEMEVHLFVVVDQMHRGAGLITDCVERTELCQLSLLAGETASAMSSFLPASAYLQAGMGLLAEEDWELHRQLCFDLYNSCAEAEYILGDFDNMKQRVEELLGRARTLHEKLRASFTLMTAMGALGHPRDAISTAITVLGHLGEPIPLVPTEAAVRQELGITQKLLRTKTKEDLLNLEDMEDVEKKEAMKFFLGILFHAQGENGQFLPLIVCRMVRLSLSHGVTRESAFGFGCYGWLLCGLIRDYAEGYRYGKLSFAILERFQANELLAKCYAVVYGFVNIWKEPLRSSLEPLKRSVEVALANGEVTAAMAASQACLQNALWSGMKLGPLLEEIERFSRLLVERKQLYILTQLGRPMEQAIRTLISGSANENMIAEEMDAGLLASINEINQSKFGNKQPHRLMRCLYQTWLYYLFGKYHLAWQSVERANKEVIQGMDRFHRECGHIFYGGLTALCLARMEGKSIYIGTIEKSIAQMGIWAASTPWTCHHKSALLNAEYAYLNGDIDGATKAYEAAIDLAARHLFVHEQALALERAGLFHLEALGDNESASTFFHKAFDCYTKWGAHCKAAHIQEYYL